MQGEIIPATPSSEDNLPPEKTGSTDEESRDISTAEANSLIIEQPPVEHQIEEAAVSAIIVVPVPVPVPEESHDAITLLITPTEVQQTSISQLGESESPSATHLECIEPEQDKNTQTEDVGLEENDRGMDEALNQRQEEEEEEEEGETRREAESKEEEEESKDGDDSRWGEEEESREGENQEAKPLEDNEEMASNVIKEKLEGEENKEGEEARTDPVAEDDGQERHNLPQAQDEQIDIDHEDDQTSLGNNAELDMDTESENPVTPAPETAVSPSSLNPVEAVDDASGDEPVVFTRRMFYEKRFHIPTAHF